MGTKTKIDYADSTWNPVTGCLHGCEYCYARGIAKRFEGGCLKADGTFHMPGRDSSFYIEGEKQLIAELKEPIYRKVNDKLVIAPYPYGFYPTLHEYRLNEYANKKERVVFVGSMTDLFGEWVPDEWIEKVFTACDNAPQHIYLFLTKNPLRYKKLAEKGILRKNDNMWYGTSITEELSAQSATIAMSDIAKMGCHNIFSSIEPLLGPIETSTLTLMSQYFKWIIIGAETGKRKDRVVPVKEWICSITSVCKNNRIPVFMKSSLEDIWKETLIQEYSFVKGEKHV